MAKRKSAVADSIVQGIGLLKGVSEAWPQGWSNPFIQEVLKNAERYLLERLYQVMDEETKTGEPLTVRPTNQSKEVSHAKR